jgi:hypothetical protein
VLVKLTPNIGDILEPGYAALDGNCDGLSLINTIKSIVGVDLDRMVPLPRVGGGSTNGGYCGPAVKPIALYMMSQLAKNPATKHMAISGIGGIGTVASAGTGTVQIGYQKEQWGLAAIYSRIQSGVGVQGTTPFTGLTYAANPNSRSDAFGVDLGDLCRAPLGVGRFLCFGFVGLVESFLGNLRFLLALALDVPLRLRLGPDDLFGDLLLEVRHFARSGHVGLFLGRRFLFDGRGRDRRRFGGRWRWRGRLRSRLNLGLGRRRRRKVELHAGRRSEGGSFGGHVVVANSGHQFEDFWFILTPLARRVTQKQ